MLPHSFTPFLLLLLLPTRPSLLLRQSHEGSDSCFTLDELHIWQLHVCPGLPPVFTHTHSAAAATHNHTTTCSGITDEAEIYNMEMLHFQQMRLEKKKKEGGCSRCVLFDIRQN